MNEEQLDRIIEGIILEAEIMTEMDKMWRATAEENKNKKQ